MLLFLPGALVRVSHRGNAAAPSSHNRRCDSVLRTAHPLFFHGVHCNDRQDSFRLKFAGEEQPSTSRQPPCLCLFISRAIFPLKCFPGRWRREGRFYRIFGVFFSCGFLFSLAHMVHYFPATYFGRCEVANLHYHHR